MPSTVPSGTCFKSRAIKAPPPQPISRTRSSRRKRRNERPQRCSFRCRKFIRIIINRPKNPRGLHAFWKKRSFSRLMPVPLKAEVGAAAGFRYRPDIAGRIQMFGIDLIGIKSGCIRKKRFQIHISCRSRK